MIDSGHKIYISYEVVRVYFIRIVGLFHFIFFFSRLPSLGEETRTTLYELKVLPERNLY